MYLYRLETGGYRQTRRMTLLRQGLEAIPVVFLAAGREVAGSFAWVHEAALEEAPLGL